MANDLEKAALRPARAGEVLADKGQQRAIADRLHALVVARLSACWPEGQVPRELGKGSLSVSSLENRLRAITALPGKQTPDVEGFAEWRKAHEAAQKQSGSDSSPSKHAGAKRKATAA